MKKTSFSFPFLGQATIFASFFLPLCKNRRKNREKGSFFFSLCLFFLFCLSSPKGDARKRCFCFFFFFYPQQIGHLGTLSKCQVCCGVFPSRFGILSFARWREGRAEWPRRLHEPRALFHCHKQGGYVSTYGEAFAVSTNHQTRRRTGLCFRVARASSRG